MFAGVGISHDPNPPGLSINRSAAAGAVQPELENAPGTRSRVEASPNLSDWAVLATVDHEQSKAVVKDDVGASWKFYRAITE